VIDEGVLPGTPPTGCTHCFPRPNAPPTLLFLLLPSHAPQVVMLFTEVTPSLVSARCD